MRHGRTLLIAVVAGVLTAVAFAYWLALPPWLAVGAGAAMTALSVLLVRILDDDADEELAAWRRIAPDLADMDREP